MKTERAVIDMQIRSSFAKIIPCFPDEIRSALSRIPPSVSGEIAEIRLRCGHSVHIVRGVRELVLTRDGIPAAEPAPGFPVTPALLDLLFRNLCAHSVHSCRDMIRNGYLTAAGGCRAGICGTAVLSENGELDTVRGISSINLRIASERIGCAETLTAILHEPDHIGGVLIAGTPASGKTTILRDYARIMGNQRRVCLLDGRGELAAVRDGIPQFDIGMQTDVFSGYPKADSVSIAVRVMNPELLICDEIGDADEVNALMQSLHTGVRLIATAHAGDADELLHRPQIRKLAEAGAFSTVVMLGRGTDCGTVRAIRRISELL